MNYSSYYGLCASGQTVLPLSHKKSLPYEEQIAAFAQAVKGADCVVVGAASGLSAAGGGDFYYEPTESFYKHFSKFAKRYGFRDAFEGSFHSYDRPEDKWAYLSTFLATTQNAPVRKPYADLAEILKNKDYFILTTNQDTQAMKVFPEDKVAEIQGDHRFFQCSRCCTDDTWDAIEPVKVMVEAQGDGTTIPTELIPRCPHCGAPMVPTMAAGMVNPAGKENYLQFLRNYHGKALVILELDIGARNQLIKAPLMGLTTHEPNFTYVTFNLSELYIAPDIAEKSFAVEGYLNITLGELRQACAG